MARTETDIREALESSFDHRSLVRLNEFATILGREDRLSHSASSATHRPRLVGRFVMPLTGAVTVAVIVAATLLMTGHTGQLSGVAGARPVLSYQFSVRDVAGYTITRNRILQVSLPSTMEQAATIIATTATDRTTGNVSLSQSNTGYGSKGAGYQSIVVNGNRGYFAPGQAVLPADLRPDLYKRPWTAAQDNNQFQPRLAWQYPDGSWAEVTGTFGFVPAKYDYDNVKALKAMTTIAVAVHVGAHDPVLVPYAFASVPAGLMAQSVRWSSGAPCLGYSDGKAPRSGSYNFSLLNVCRVRSAATRAATIKETEFDQNTGSAVFVRNVGDGTSLVVQVDLHHGISADQVQHCVNAADVSPNLNDPATWLAAR